MEARTISLPLPLKMGQVNAYLVRTDNGYFLIDTGGSSNRKQLVSELETAGCLRGQLRMIILTHGDFDHTGNAAFLRKEFGGLIAMHPGDSGMVAKGDMFVNRKQPNIFVKLLIPLFTGFGRAERFSPDLLLEDGFDLSRYGLAARIVSIPGHSQGSIGVLTADHELFCGDLFDNLEEPGINSIMDDVEKAKVSAEKLSGMGVSRVHPGHGASFPFDEVRGRT